jgi:serine phosphatase RsbU (regulator of sigma subunit)
MKLRVRLIVAFLLLSVVPLGAVTIYSYVSNYQALQTVATREADQMAEELSQRMQLVTTQLSERVEHLMDVSTPAAPPARKPDTKTADASAATTAKTEAVAGTSANASSVMAKLQAADALGEAALLLNTVELRGMRGPGGGRGRGLGGPQPLVAPDGRFGTNTSDFRRGPRGGSTGPGPSVGSPPPAPVAPAMPAAPSAPPALMAAPPPTRPVDTNARSVQPDPRARKLPMPPGRQPRGTAPPDGGSQPGETGVPPPPDAGAGPGDDQSDRIHIDVGPIARDIFRQFVPEGTNPNELTSDQRQRVAAEINQRMTGITEGLKMAAEQIKLKADAARKVEEAAKAAAQAQAAVATKRRTALSGSRLNVVVEENGKVVRTANAEVNLPNVLMTVFSSMPRGQGEVPFALGKDGRVYTPTASNRATIEQLAPARLANGASMVADFIIVITNDPTGSGLRLGIARPVGDSLSELRRTAGRNAGLGLACIGLSIALIFPLSGRLTRNLSRLTEGVTRIAHGDYGARVAVKSKDEIGGLATAFNQMAADVEVHQRSAVEQERIKRELELGRQIQQDMQPQEPLRLGFTEIQGVSVPAREVGGDFFNYFAIDDGQIALLVGDVSGKGVGAALLMANIQASLRTRFALGQDLSAIADAIDRDIEANSPGQMYATLFVGILDSKTRGLRYVNAGHHPQFVLRKGAGLQRMSATGLPAGLLAGRGYTEEHVQLETGDLIFFYTDGCPETENGRDEMFGSDRLERLIAEASPTGADDLLQRVESALKEFRGTREPFDDATMMAVRVG